jgi:hypothetical protein
LTTSHISLWNASSDMPAACLRSSVSRRDTSTP